MEVINNILFTAKVVKARYISMDGGQLFAMNASNLFILPYLYIINYMLIDL